MHMAVALCLSSSLYKSEKGNSTRSTVVGSLQYFLICPVLFRQTATAQNRSFSIQLRKGRIFWPVVLQALRQRADYRTSSSSNHVSELCCSFWVV